MQKVEQADSQLPLVTCMTLASHARRTELCARIDLMDRLFCLLVGFAFSSVLLMGLELPKYIFYLQSGSAVLACLVVLRISFLRDQLREIRCAIIPLGAFHDDVCDFLTRED